MAALLDAGSTTWNGQLLSTFGYQNLRLVALAIGLNPHLPNSHAGLLPLVLTTLSAIEPRPPLDPETNLTNFVSNVAMGNPLPALNANAQDGIHANDGVPALQAAPADLPPPPAGDAAQELAALKAEVAALRAKAAVRVPVHSVPSDVLDLGQWLVQADNRVTDPRIPNIDLFIQAFSRFRNDTTSYVLMGGDKPTWLTTRDSIYDQLAIIHRVGIECHCLDNAQSDAWHTLNRGHLFKLADDTYLPLKTELSALIKASDGWFQTTTPTS
ncbi:hypothetical protein BC829DRAFT_422461 [Chytridium lagenaria]|nr:hypothetical protein BC829DRAFT_422461 [Chytridium lagenaria]